MDYSRRTSRFAASAMFMVVLLAAAACSTEVVVAGGELLQAAEQPAANALDSGLDGPTDTALDGTLADANAAAGVNASTTASLTGTAVADVCPVGAEESTANVLRSLAPDLRDASAERLASEVENLASSFEAPEPPAEALASLMAVLPQVAGALEGQEDVPCLGVLQSALSRIGIGSGEPVAAAQAEPGDDLATVLARGYGLSAQDADCVADGLNDTPIDQIDDLTVLVALSTCTNDL